MVDTNNPPLTAAHIEIIQPMGPDVSTWVADMPIQPGRVLINGHDVGLIARDGITVNPGDAGCMTTVTLKLIPGHVEIKRAGMPTECPDCDFPHATGVT